MRIPTPLLGFSWRLERMPGLQMVLRFPERAELPEPFSTHRRIEEMLSYPKRNNNNDIKFVVDDSNTCARVRAALSEASSVFAYKDDITEPDGLWEPTKWMPLFHDALSEEEQKAVAEMLEQKKLPIDALLKVASPASFGKDGEKVYDPEVRKAFEIPRSQLPSDLLDVLKIESIERLEYKMKPKLRRWTYHLYKIHMYGPGGKFEEHVDTLHTSNHVATVVLSLPSEHVGGVLRVRHHGEAVEFDLSKVPRQDGHRFLTYGAFFTDCTHSVQEVISGWRVVVQYDVFEEIGIDEELEDEDDYYTFACLDEYSTSIDTSMVHKKEPTALVQAVSEYMATIPPTDGVAFFLRHRYSLPALNEVVLKGADRIIYDAFSKRADLSISVQGAVAYLEIESEWPVSIEVKGVSMKDFVRGPYDQKEEMDPDVDTKRKVDPSSTVHLIVDEHNGSTCVHENFGYMGNEPSDDCTSYFVACMIIRSAEK
jgi:hypothetical protein